MRGNRSARAQKGPSGTGQSRTGQSRTEGTSVDAAVDIDRIAAVSAAGGSTNSEAASESSGAHALASKTPRISEFAARELALRFLERRARTRHELLAHLRQRGVPDEMSESITLRFEETGLIDDQELAERWVGSRQAAKSARQLQAELVRRGVQRDVAASAARAVDADVEEAAMLRLIDRRAVAMRDLSAEAKQRRLMAQLARRGYPADAARRCVQRVLGDPGEEATGEEGPPLPGGTGFLDQV